MSEFGPGPDPSEMGSAAVVEWQADAATEKTTNDSSAPVEPELSIAQQVEQPEAPTQETSERLEADPLRALEFAQERARQELAERYHLEDPNILKRFSGNVRAFFSGEFADLRVSEDLANRERTGEITAKDFQKEVSRSYKLAGSEGLRKLGKIAAKTGVGAGIGAGVVAALGGTVASPIFLGALAGGAIARGGFELYRHLNSKERDARTGVIESRTQVFREAIKYQDEAQVLNTELANEATPPERREEISNRLSEITRYLIDLTAFESYQAMADQRPKGESIQERTGLALTRERATVKMAFEKKRETASDLIAAGGSIIGGLAGQAVQHALVHSAEAANGFVANFDKQGAGHFVDKISPDQIRDYGQHFIRQLHESGGYVFHYNSPQEAASALKLAAEHHYALTQAVLKDGSIVHVLPGMNDAIFSHMLPHGVAESVAAIKGSLLKEALPVAAGQLINLIKFFSGRSQGAEQPGHIAAPAEVNGPSLPMPSVETPAGSIDSNQSALPDGGRPELPVEDNVIDFTSYQQARAEKTEKVAEDNTASHWDYDPKLDQFVDQTGAARGKVESLDWEDALTLATKARSGESPFPSDLSMRIDRRLLELRQQKRQAA